MNFLTTLVRRPLSAPSCARTLKSLRGGSADTELDTLEEDRARQQVEELTSRPPSYSHSCSALSDLRTVIKISPCHSSVLYTLQQQAVRAMLPRPHPDQGRRCTVLPAADLAHPALESIPFPLAAQLRAKRQNCTAIRWHNHTPYCETSKTTSQAA